MISSLRWETWGSVYPWCPSLFLSRGVQISLPCMSILVYCISSHLQLGQDISFFFLFLFLVVVFLTVVIEISLFLLAMFSPGNRQKGQNWTTMALWCCPFSIQGHKSYFTVISWDVKCCHWKSFKMKIVLLIFFFLFCWRDWREGGYYWGPRICSLSTANDWKEDLEKGGEASRNFKGWQHAWQRPP